jgi:multidrug transporter EmrE-like cation transporter
MALSPGMLRLCFLLLLCVQNAAITLTLRYSRGVLKEKWLISSSVVCMEFFKLIFSIVMMTIQEKQKQGTELQAAAEASIANRTEVMHARSASHNYDSPDESASPLVAVALPSPIEPEPPLKRRSTIELLLSRMKLLLRSSAQLAPLAAMYFGQNCLVYTGLQHLDSATYSILSQLKLLTTAVFSVVVLQRQLAWFQWRALLLLFLGVVLVQYRDDAAKESKDGAQNCTAPRDTRCAAFRCTLPLCCACPRLLMSSLAPSVCLAPTSQEISSWVCCAWAV